MAQRTGQAAGDAPDDTDAAGDAQTRADAAESRHVPGDVREDSGDRSEEPGAGDGRRERPLLRIGRYAWAAVGILAVLVAAGLLAGQLVLVIVPMVIALFPAALLAPLASFLKKHRVPAALAAVASILALLLGIATIVGVLVPVVAAELPDLAESFGEGVEELEGLVEDLPFGLGAGGIDQLLEQGREWLGEADQLAGQAFTAVTTVLEGIVALLFGLVVLFFYLKDGGQIARGISDLLPASWREHANAIGGRVWWTLGAYFRGQLLVAFVDAVFIGLGLWILQVPLALPLAVLVFFGGLFPIIGAVVSGAVAVLVALADAGLVIALIVLGLILAVQQLESNVLEPVVLSRAIALHPLAVIVAITAGAVTLGILGAFLAVPIAASIGRVIDYLHGRPPTSEAQAEAEEKAIQGS